MEKIIDNYKVDGKFDDMMDHIGRANIAESSQIDFNLDAIIFIVPCWEGDVKWQAFKLVKHRYKTDMLPSEYVFFHPFVYGMPARMEEDVHRAEPLSRRNLVYNKETSQTAQAFSNASNDFNKNARFSMNKSLKNENTVILKDETTGFMSLTMARDDNSMSDYEDGKEKKSVVVVFEEESIDEDIFNDCLQQIVEFYNTPQLMYSCKYKEEIERA